MADNPQTGATYQHTTKIALWPSKKSIVYSMLKFRRAILKMAEKTIAKKLKTSSPLIGTHKYAESLEGDAQATD